MPCTIQCRSGRATGFRAPHRRLGRKAVPDPCPRIEGVSSNLSTMRASPLSERVARAIPPARAPQRRQWRRREGQRRPVRRQVERQRAGRPVPADDVVEHARPAGQRRARPVPGAEIPLERPRAGVRVEIAMALPAQQGASKATSTSAMGRSAARYAVRPVERKARPASPTASADDPAHWLAVGGRDLIHGDRQPSEPHRRRLGPSW